MDAGQAAFENSLNNSCANWINDSLGKKEATNIENKC